MSDRGDESTPIKPAYEAPRLSSLDVSETASGGAGAFEANFGNEPIFQAS